MALLFSRRGRGILAVAAHASLPGTQAHEDSDRASVLLDVARFRIVRRAGNELGQLCLGFID
jgi:hypothetical protein